MTTACHRPENAPDPLQSPGVVMGQVVNQQGPVAGAEVRLAGASPETTTDGQGRFVLEIGSQLGGKITAWKEGHLIAVADLTAARRPLRLTLKSLPEEGGEAYKWVDPRPDPSSSENCGNCHGAVYRQWSTSGHAHAARNRHLRSFVEGTDWDGRAAHGWSLLAEHPDGATVCFPCHNPTLPSDQWLEPSSFPIEGPASQGIHCDFCHKVEEVIAQDVGLAHGRLGMQLRRPASGQVFFGPLKDAVRGSESFAPVFQESRYCAACHEGVVFGVHVYSTYSEWLASPASRRGQSCQSCHMASSGTLSNLAPGKGGIPRDPLALSSHSFMPGGHQAMLRKAVKVQVRSQRTAERLQVEVELSAEDVGHRVPTGFIDRHLVLVVEPLNDWGKLLEPSDVLLSGVVLPAFAGEALAGRPGKIFGRLLTDEQGRRPAPFWRPIRQMEDTRLEPGKPTVVPFEFAEQTAQLRVRLLYRPFWASTTEEKGFPEETLTVKAIDYRL